MNAGERLYPVIKDLVGGRVYQMRRQEGADPTTPYIVYSPVSSVPENSIDGFLGHEYARVQLDFYHNDYDELDQMVNLAIAAINRNIVPSEYGGRRHLYDDESTLYRQSVDYEFWTRL